MDKFEIRHKSRCMLALIFLFAGTAHAQRQDQTAPWFFIQLTDPQLGMFDHNASLEKETALYEKAVAKINTLNPDFVVITGDFVNDEKSADQIRAFKQITTKIKPSIRVYYTPGNHDIGQVPNKESLKNYKKNYGRDWFSFRHKGASLIGFNTGLIKAKLEKAEQKQFNRLANKLRQSQHMQHIILFTHYPFFNKTFDEPTAYSNIDQEYREKYLRLFSNNRVTALFSGHYHNNSRSSYQNVQFVTTSALGKPLGDAPSGCCVVIVYPDKIEHMYYGLEVLPDSIII